MLDLLISNQKPKKKIMEKLFYMLVNKYLAAIKYMKENCSGQDTVWTPRKTIKDTTVPYNSTWEAKFH